MRKRLIGYAAISGMYLILHYYVQHHDVVAALFAAGSHLKAGTLILAVSFVALRLFVMLCLPALAGGYLAHQLLERLFPRHATENHGAEG